MDKRATIRLLGLLAIGFVLGHLADVGPGSSQPKALDAKHRAESAAPGEEMAPVAGKSSGPRDPPRKKWAAVASSPLVVALISAIVAGVVSFAVARYQNEASRGQAVSSQQTQELLRMEQSGDTLYEDAQNIAISAIKCSFKGQEWSTCFFINPEFTKYLVDIDAFSTTIQNVSDQQADKIAEQIAGKAAGAMASKDKTRGFENIAQMGSLHIEHYSKPHMIEKKKSARAASNASG
jgi:hypothetical protein